MSREILPYYSGERNIQKEKERKVNLARAMATRSFDEGQKSQIRIAEITGGEYTPTPDIVRECLISIDTLMNERILDNPSSLPTNPYELVASTYDNVGDDVFDRITHEIQGKEEEPLPITAPQLRSISKAIRESAVNTFAPTSVTGKGFTDLLKQVDEAKKIGAEKGVNPTVVYTDDELYAELIRRTNTPIETAKGGITMIKLFTSKKMSEFVMNMIPAFTQLIEKIEGEEQSSQEEIQEMKQEISEDPDFKKTVRDMTLQYKKATRIIITEQIIRFWGQEGLDSLSETAKKELHIIK